MSVMQNWKKVRKAFMAPELLFGARMYGVGIDMWAVGCIICELLLKAPFLPGESDLDQLTRIFQTLGTPSEDTWPGVTKLQDFIQFKVLPGIPLNEIFTAAGDDLLLYTTTIILITGCYQTPGLYPVQKSVKETSFVLDIANFISS
ncbi:cyclin-dependent kinase 7-like [Diaphorina citri]|uniref:[RNA-polymerase]-subunit kinase n=1 Tax=Diaphorina citri TaxID=121845 RepID=A0A3Q0JQM6_DIACI|nr:cyclin-dependent kinase 7-like [Diaphorina citri]